MSSFTTELIFEPLDDGIHWKVLEPFTYDVGELGGDDSITVPPGFVTDLASVPYLFRWIIPVWGRYGKAAVLHDWLYQLQDRSRKAADDILLEAMTVLDVSAFCRFAIYRAVRIGGWVAWNKNQKKKI